MNYPRYFNFNIGGLLWFKFYFSMKQKFNIMSSTSQIVVMGNYIALMDVI
jgi:hypothetical protein